MLGEETTIGDRRRMQHTDKVDYSIDMLQCGVVCLGCSTAMDKLHSNNDMQAEGKGTSWVMEAPD